VKHAAGREAQSDCFVWKYARMVEIRIWWATAISRKERRRFEEEAMNLYEMESR
jgi:hypothetical protein